MRWRLTVLTRGAPLAVKHVTSGQNPYLHTIVPNRSWRFLFGMIGHSSPVRRSGCRIQPMAGENLHHRY